MRFLILLLLLSCSHLTEQKSVVSKNPPEINHTETVTPPPVEESFLHKEKILYVDWGKIWITDFDRLDQTVQQKIQSIKNKRLYGEHDITPLLKDFLGSSQKVVSVRPSPSAALNLKSTFTRKISSVIYRLEKDAGPFGDCHNYPLEHILIRFEKTTAPEENSGLIIDQASTYYQYPKKEIPVEYELFSKFLFKLYKKNYNPFDRDGQLRHHIDQSTTAFRDDGDILYFIGPHPSLDSETSQIYRFDPETDTFILFKKTYEMLCGS